MRAFSRVPALIKTRPRWFSSETLRALVLSKNQGEKVCTREVKELRVDDLPEGDVLIDVSHSCLNFKDAMIIKNGGNIVRNWPFVPGIDFAGRVISSGHSRYKEGDSVILTGWRVGEAYWGGLATKARVKGEWLVPMPEGMTPETSMALGTAGLAAMLGIMALESHGLTPETKGSVLVTGATGGVGSLAVAMLKSNGYHVTASTRNVDANEVFLKRLGVDEIIASAEFEQDPTRPLDATRWSGAIDNVGGTTLSNILAQLNWRCSVASVGLASSPAFNGNVIPFLLRGTNLLGVESAAEPFQNRLTAWGRMGEEVPSELLASLTTTITLDEAADTALALLKGETTGRVVVRL